jgi:hypothetical protein
VYRTLREESSGKCDELRISLPPTGKRGGPPNAKMPPSPRLRWAFVTHIGIYICVFHHQWCNSFMPTKSCVNEGLQRHQNVLLLGPFEKVSQRLTEPVLFQSPTVSIQGPTSGNKAIGKQ